MLWLHLEFTAGLLLYLSPCGIHFAPAVFWKLNSSRMFIMSLLCRRLTVCLPILNCDWGGKGLSSFSVRQVTLDCTHHLPQPLTPFSVHLFPRLSDLSLRSMHPCPIPDAEAHGKNSNSCPEQLYLSNGEVSWCLFFLSLHLHAHSTL